MISRTLDPAAEIKPSSRAPGTPCTGKGVDPTGRAKSTRVPASPVRRALKRELIAQSQMACFETLYDYSPMVSLIVRGLGPKLAGA
eukprot:1131503-Rhodomonas_salina.3